MLLFLFIPLVLWLLVGQPEPLVWSFAAALILMFGHRFAARPFMQAVRRKRCVWCCRELAAEEADELLVDAAGRPRAGEASRAAETVATLACRLHREPAGRFFGFLEAARLPLALGIFLPLLALLAALAATVLGWPAPLEQVTAGFRLTVGLTVVAASAFYPLAADRQATAGRPPRVAFPLHNFFLIGVRALLWVFRLVGAWWIVLGLRSLFVG